MEQANTACTRTAGSLRRFQAFFWLEVFSALKPNLPPTCGQRQPVGWLRWKNSIVLNNPTVEGT